MGTHGAFDDEIATYMLVMHLGVYPEIEGGERMQQGLT
jgi:hypothetical protein